MKRFASFSFIKPEGNTPIVWDMISFTKYKKVYPRFSDSDFKKIEAAIKTSGSLSRHKSKWYNLNLSNLLNKPSSELEFIIDADLRLLNIGIDNSESRPRPFFISETTYSLLEKISDEYAKQLKKPKSKIKQYLVMLAVDMVVN